MCAQSDALQARQDAACLLSAACMVQLLGIDTSLHLMPNPEIEALLARLGDVTGAASAR